MLDLKQVLLTVTILKEKVLEFALNLHTILPIDNLATSQGRNWAQVELLLVTGQGFKFLLLE